MDECESFDGVVLFDFTLIATSYYLITVVESLVIYFVVVYDCIVWL